MPNNHPVPFIDKKQELTKQILARQEKKFMGLLNTIMEKAKGFGITIRVMGSLAFRIKCPDYKYLEYKNKHYLPDIDFIAYSKEIVRVQDLFFSMNWTENQNVLRLFGNKRRIFYHPDNNIHVDIFIDKLRFCHEIDFRNRLEIDFPTISLIDLLLQKLQIVEINKKDLVDVMVLLCQYPVSKENNDQNIINGFYLAKICSKAWGLWKTATTNLQKIYDFSEEYLDEKEAKEVRNKIKTLEKLIQNHKKNLKWKIRSIIGERMKWYQEVEEVQRD